MQWNKINVDSMEILIKDNNPLFLEITKPLKLKIKVLENISTRLVIIANNDYDIELDLSKSANLVINSINKDNSVNAIVNLLEKSKITYNHSVLANNDSKNSFNINHLKSDSISNLFNNGINMSKNKLIFTINGEVDKKNTNITCNQKSKIINYDKGYSKIIPNLIINSNDIIANHSAYIGEIEEEEMFYSKSRGINELDIKKIFYKAIMLGTMELFEEESEFNKRINEWW